MPRGQRAATDGYGFISSVVVGDHKLLDAKLEEPLQSIHSVETSFSWAITMDGVLPMDATTFCREDSKRSRVGNTTLVLVLGSSVILCVLSLTVAVFCMCSMQTMITEMTEMREQYREETDQLQFRVAEVEARCKQITDSGFPAQTDLGEADDAMTSAREIPSLSHAGLVVKGDPGDMAENDRETTGEQHTVSERVAIVFFVSFWFQYDT